MSRYHDLGDTADVTLAADAIVGDFVQTDSGLAGYLPTGGSTGDFVGAQVRGIVEDVETSTSFAGGDSVEWDATNNVAVATTLGDFVIGIAEHANTAPAGAVVRLNGV